MRLYCDQNGIVNGWAGTRASILPFLAFQGRHWAIMHQNSAHSRINLVRLQERTFRILYLLPEEEAQ